MLRWMVRACSRQVRTWAKEFGFSQIGVAGIDLSSAEPGLWRGSTPASTARCTTWRARHEARAAGRAGAGHGERDHRAHGLPAARLGDELAGGRVAAPARPARGHGVALCPRARLSQGAARAAAGAGRAHRAGRSARSATASSPIRRRCSKSSWPRRSGIGWRGKHTLALSREAGSMFFLGEIFVDLALPPTPPVRGALRHLQRLHRRLPDAGHRRAVPARCAALHLLPDDRARRADSAGAAAADRQPHLRLRRLPARLPVEQVRAAQRAARLRCAPGPRRRHAAALWAWSEAEFLQRTEGSAIRRIGWQRWRRNLAVALGNALRATRRRRRCRQALRAARDSADALRAASTSTGRLSRMKRRATPARSAR